VSEETSPEQLLEQVRRMAYKAAYGRIRDHHLSEDVAQEITEEFNRRGAEILDPNRWVPVAAKRLAARRLHQHQQRGIVGGDDDSVDPVFDEGYITNQSLESNRKVMKDARQMLPVKDRQILELYYLADLPLSDIAELLGIEEIAAQKRLQRARERAKERWRDDEGIRVVLQRR
jgi:RNA polymerase sigma factor (sigma-70 family)